MEIVLRGHDGVCLFLIRLLLTAAIRVEEWRCWVYKRGVRLHGSLQKLLRQWRGRHRPHAPPVPPGAKRRGGWNRTPLQVERQILRLHVEVPHLGAGQLGHLVHRLVGVQLARETIRRISLRNQGLLPEIELEQEKRKRRIVVHAPRRLWGMDLTLVWVLGFFPVWVLGIVDYHGSRLVALEPLPWPGAAAVVRATERAFAAEGAPERVLTDRGGDHKRTGVSSAYSVLERDDLRALLACAESCPAHRDLYGLRDVLHRPSAAQRLWRKDPDEVHAGRPVQPGHAGRIAFFEGRLLCWRFS